ncbi:hypothetical protein HSIEG1_1731 [Enterococcus sp. HSIEG1]|nr:hypothetical protein HSIEG1_1731 [Enterococcus sp. HSIEG1]
MYQQNIAFYDFISYLIYIFTIYQSIGTGDYSDAIILR